MSVQLPAKSIACCFFQLFRVFIISYLQLINPSIGGPRGLLLGVSRVRHLGFYAIRQTTDSGKKTSAM